MARSSASISAGFAEKSRDTVLARAAIQPTGLAPAARRRRSNHPYRNRSKMAPIGVTRSLVERVDINFANIEGMHFTEEVSNPAQIGCGFINRLGLRRLCPRSRYLMSGLRSAR